MIKLISIYDRIQAAHERCQEIEQQLKTLSITEDIHGESRSLNREYLWTVSVIIRLCDDLLETEPEDVYGEEVDFRINIVYFQERYENILEDLKAHA